MLFHRNMEHLLGSGAVDVTAVCEGIKHPLFACIPGKDPALNCGEVRDDELLTWCRDKGRPDKLRECIRDILVEETYRIKVASLYKRPGFCEVWQMVLREVLKLHDF